MTPFKARDVQSWQDDNDDIYTADVYTTVIYQATFVFELELHDLFWVIWYLNISSVTLYLSCIYYLRSNQKWPAAWSIDT